MNNNFYEKKNFKYYLSILLLVTCIVVIMINFAIRRYSIIRHSRETSVNNSHITENTDIYSINLITDNISKANSYEIDNKDKMKAYTSTVYKMLNIGDNGILSAINYELEEIELPIICIKNVYRGDDAEKIIKDYYASGDCIYSHFDVPEGCHCEAVNYDLSYRNCNAEDYVDIRVVGLDGKKLEYSGIAYPMRTYNIDNLAVQDGDWKRGYYVFYAIPDGCTDYVLMCGDYKEGIGTSPAYYRIKY